MADARALISLSVRSYIICAPHHPPSSDPCTYLPSGTDGHQQTEREFRLSLCASHSHPWREQQHQSCASYIHGSDHIIRAGEVSRVDLSISRLLRGRLFCGQSETIVPPSCPSAQTQCSFPRRLHGTMHSKGLRRLTLGISGRSLPYPQG